MFDPSELLSALLRFRELIAQGYQPESAFCLAHDGAPPDPDPMFADIRENCAEMRAVLDRNAATIAEMRALLAR